MSSINGYSPAYLIDEALQRWWEEQEGRNGIRPELLSRPTRPSECTWQGWGAAEHQAALQQLALELPSSARKAYQCAQVLRAYALRPDTRSLTRYCLESEISIAAANAWASAAEEGGMVWTLLGALERPSGLCAMPPGTQHLAALDRVLDILNGLVREGAPVWPSGRRVTPAFRDAITAACQGVRAAFLEYAHGASLYHADLGVMEAQQGIPVPIARCIRVLSWCTRISDEEVLKAHCQDSKLAVHTANEWIKKAEREGVIPVILTALYRWETLQREDAAKRPTYCTQLCALLAVTARLRGMAQQHGMAWPSAHPITKNLEERLCDMHTRLEGYLRPFLMAGLNIPPPQQWTFLSPFSQGGVP